MPFWRLVLPFFLLLASTGRSERGVAAIQLELLKNVVARKTGDNTIALMSASQAAIEFFLPQILHSFKRLGTTHDHLVIVAHSPASLKACRALHPACILDDWQSTSLQHDAAHDLEAITHFGSPAFLQGAWRRVELVRDVLFAGVSVLSLDLDIAFFKDPIEFVRSLAVGRDILYAAEQGWGDEANMGYYFVRTSEAGRAFMAKMVELGVAEPQGFDQAVFNQLLGSDLTLAKAMIPREQGRSFCHMDSLLYPEIGNIGYCIRLVQDLLHAHYHETAFMHFPCLVPWHNMKALMTYAAQMVLYEHADHFFPASM